MFDLYFDLPSWLRTTLALVILTSGITMTWYGHVGRPMVTEEKLPGRGTRVVVKTKAVEDGFAELFKIGLGVTGLGVVLLVVCGKDGAEKTGYHF